MGFLGAVIKKIPGIMFGCRLALKGKWLKFNEDLFVILISKRGSVLNLS